MAAAFIVFVMPSNGFMDIDIWIFEWISKLLFTYVFISIDWKLSKRRGFESRFLLKLQDRWAYFFNIIKLKGTFMR